MRRTGLILLGLTCFVLAADLADWPCFDEVINQSSAPEMSDGDECPPNLFHRQQVLEPPPALPALFSAALCEISALDPTCCGLVSEVCPRAFPGVALAYIHMSIQS